MFSFILHHDATAKSHLRLFSKAGIAAQIKEIRAGGGDDIFTFGENWGADTVEQLADGEVTLWFASGDISKWNAGSLTYADGENSVTISGVTADRVSLKFGDDGSEEYVMLSASGAFTDTTSEKIFEEKGKGVLAVL